MRSATACAPPGWSAASTRPTPASTSSFPGLARSNRLDLTQDRWEAVQARAASHRVAKLRLHAVFDRVQLDVLAGPRDRDRFQHADARLVELVLVLGLEQRVVLRLQNVAGEAPE